MDLASQGYVVIAPNHQDGSCMYTTTAKEEEMYLDQKPFYVKDLRRKQVDRRVLEVQSLIKDLRNLTPEFRERILGPVARDAEIDMDELVVMGHSFGGITAMLVAS